MDWNILVQFGTAVLTAFTAFLAYKARQAAEQSTKNTEETMAIAKQTEINTNSITERLEASAHALGRREGMDAGIASGEAKAKTLAQGQREGTPTKQPPARRKSPKKGTR